MLIFHSLMAMNEEELVALKPFMDLHQVMDSARTTVKTTTCLGIGSRGN